MRVVHSICAFPCALSLSFLPVDKPFSVMATIAFPFLLPFLVRTPFDILSPARLHLSSKQLPCQPYCASHSALQGAPWLSISFTAEFTTSTTLLVINTWFTLAERTTSGWVSSHPAWLSQANPRKKTNLPQHGFGPPCVSRDATWINGRFLKLQTTWIKHRLSCCCKLNSEIMLEVSSFVLEHEELGWALNPPPSPGWQVSFTF